MLEFQKKYGNRYVQRLMGSMKQDVKSEIAPEVALGIEQSRRDGQVLGQGERAQMEQVFRADFSRVKIHTDSRANLMTRALNSVAFTSGQDIFFRQGSHDPVSAAGRELLAHELAHVAQQSKDAVQNELSLGQPGDPYERDADKMAQHAISAGTGRESGKAGTSSGGELQSVGTRNPVIRRQSDDGTQPGQPASTGAAAAGPQPDLTIIAPGVIPSLAIVHSTDSFDVQWKAGNLGAGASQAFKDKLQVFRVSDSTNQCPGSDADLGDPVYDSDNDSNVNLQEGPIAPMQAGPLTAATVGPFTSGSYRLTVTVNSDFGEPNESSTANNSTFNCIDIQP